VKLDNLGLTVVLLLILGSGAESLAQGHILRGKVRNAAGSNLSQATVTLEKTEPWWIRQ